MVITHNITLDVARKGIQAVIPVTQHDINSHRIIIKLKNGGVPISLSNNTEAAAYLHWIDSDTFETVNVRDNDDPAMPNVLVFTLTSITTEKVGDVDVTLQIYSNSENFYFAPTFTLCVSKNPTKDTQVASSPAYADIIRIREEIEGYAYDAESAAEGAKNSATEARNERIAAENAAKTAAEDAVSAVSETIASDATRAGEAANRAENVAEEAAKNATDAAEIIASNVNRAESAANRAEEALTRIEYVGQITFDDDDNGNVMVSVTGNGGVTLTDDGNGNVTLEVK